MPKVETKSNDRDSEKHNKIGIKPGETLSAEIRSLGLRILRV